MASYLEQSRGDFSQRLETALSLVAEHAADAAAVQTLQEKIDGHRGRYSWLVPDLSEPMDARYAPDETPADFAVLAVDGSQIEVERDAPAACFLLNVGRVTLRYGSAPGAKLESVPVLHFGDERLVIRDPRNYTRERAVDGAILAALRATAEVRALAELARELPDGLPAVGLLDGTLVRWDLSGGPDAYVKEQLLADYLAALEELQRIAAERPFAVASYISLPRATEAVNALRIAVCPYPIPDCAAHCKQVPNLQRSCDVVAKVRDRDLFARVLTDPGCRSSLFETRSLVNQEYGPHAVSFWYLNTGRPQSRPETARVETPKWSHSRLRLLHSVIWDQVQLGDGYPLALAEAHEKAVIRAADRELFWQMVGAVATGDSLAAATSQKNVAKRRRLV
jgi:hypothetical protein